jgi:uncharacterized lipoprotein YmbA
MPLSSLRALFLTLAATGALALGGCGSSPDPIYYGMSSVRDPHPVGAVSWAHLIKLRRPAIAGYLDRAEIVSGVSHYRLRVASGESWSEPLGDMAGRVLAEDLGERLPSSVVFVETSPISAAPDAIVSVDIQRFDTNGDGTLTLHAEISVERGSDRGVLGVRSVDLHEHVPLGNTADLAAAMSRLLGELAGQVVPYLTDPNRDASAPAVARAPE